MLLDIFDPKAPPRAIGIDLGTTHSLVAFVSDECPRVIVDCNGKSLVPSVVYYGERGEVVVGDPAVSRAADEPQVTIASAKRLMGKGADDPQTRQFGPYSFIAPAPGEANVVRFAVRERGITPVEVSAEILRALKRLAEDELRSVGGAVITVPAYFDDAQRQATKDAARLAGLDVLRLLNEPTAAALAYGLESKQNGTFAVYDLGGGTFDITVLVLDNGVFQVKSTGGDSALGGDDMDRVLAEELLHLAGCEQSAQSPERIRVALDVARKVKHGLTDALEVEVENPFGVTPPTLVIARSRFEQLIEPLLARSGVACRRALRDAELSAQDLDGVILVGGATRVPAVRAFVRHLFGKEGLSGINPDEVVALGAAIHANQLAGLASSSEALLLDVIPLSLGIEVGGGVVDRILPRNTTIPAVARAVYTTQEDNQTGFEIHVVQGERELASDCRSLARFLLRGIPPMPAGLARLEITFRVDADGLLSVHAREERTGIEQAVHVKPSYGLDDASVEQMLMAAIDHGEEDLRARRLAEARTDARRMAASTEKSMAQDPELLIDGERESIERALRELERAVHGADIAALRGQIEHLDHATKAFAERRMNSAIAKALEGQAVERVEQRVEHAKGIEAAHEFKRAGVSALEDASPSE